MFYLFYRSILERFLTSPISENLLSVETIWEIQTEDSINFYTFCSNWTTCPFVPLMWYLLVSGSTPSIELISNKFSGKKTFSWIQWNKKFLETKQIYVRFAIDPFRNIYHSFYSPNTTNLRAQYFKTFSSVGTQSFIFILTFRELRRVYTSGLYIMFKQNFIMSWLQNVISSCVSYFEGKQRILKL